jgi:hypothetical protein
MLGFCACGLVQTAFWEVGLFRFFAAVASWNETSPKLTRFLLDSWELDFEMSENPRVAARG